MLVYREPRYDSDVFSSGTVIVPGVASDRVLHPAKFFGMSPQFWLGLQAQYDLDVAEDKILTEIEQIQPVQAASA